MLSFISELLYAPVDLFMHSTGTIDSIFILTFGFCLYSAVLFFLFLTVWLVYYLLDTVGIVVQEQEATVQSLTFVPSSTTLMPMQAGKTLIMIPQFQAATWKVTMQVEDKIWSTSISQATGNLLKVGQNVCVEYRKGRISNKAHIVNVGYNHQGMKVKVYAV